MQPALIATWVLGGGLAVAAQPPAADVHPPVQAAGITLDRAIAIAEMHYKARVVRAAEEDSEGRRSYVLRLLSDEGRVWTIHVDAQTGVMN